MKLHINRGYFVILSLLAVLLIYSNNPSDNPFDNPSDLEMNRELQPYSADDYLIIVGNGQLAAEASSGSGTEEEPYILEGYDINGGGLSIILLNITNTTAYFEVRDSKFYHSIGYPSMILSNVTNGKLINNTISNTVNLLVEDSNNIILKNNTFYDFQITGIGFDNTNDSSAENNNIMSDSGTGINNYKGNNNNFTNNNITGLLKRGIYMFFSPNISCTYNYINGCEADSGIDGMGIFIGGNCEYANISYNEIYNCDGLSENDGGIGIWCYADNCTFVNNTLANMKGNGQRSGLGLTLVGSLGNNITKNYFGNNTGNGEYSGNGMLLRNADTNTFMWNTFEENEHYGLDIDSSSDNNLIYNNQFLNNGDGSQAEAMDNGTNKWYTGNVGNYWSNYRDLYPAGVSVENLYWSVNYTIAGTAIINDTRPLINYYHGYMPSQRISINSNEDLALYASKGSGTSEYPYLFENLAINNTGIDHDLIRIQSTTAHYVIKDCLFLDDLSTDYGIYLLNSDNAKIKNNIISKVVGHIYIGSSTNIEISDCNISDGERGIYLSGCNDIQIHDNVLNKLSDLSICINGGSNGLIERNSISNGNGRGIYLTNYFHNATFVDNQIVNITAVSDGDYISNGVFAFRCQFLDFINNTFNNCSYDRFNNGIGSGNGFICHTCENISLISCKASYNHGQYNFGGNGFALMFSKSFLLRNCTSNNNTCIDSTGTHGGNGFTVYSFNNITIEQCNAYDNYGDVDKAGNGIDLYSVSDYNISMNNIFDNHCTIFATSRGCGIYSDASSNGLIYKNQIHHNANYGTKIHGSSNTIYYNNYTDNQMGGTQASGGGFDNSYDFHGIGNYWSDYESEYPFAVVAYNTYWIQPYAIAGSGAMDYYPLFAGGYTPLAPIEISNDETLEDISSSGLGTVFKPYIIENIYINASAYAKSALLIEYTTKTFIVRNCAFIDADNYMTAGLEIQYAQYGHIENLIVENSYSGVLVVHSSNIDVGDCEIFNCIAYGIWYYNTSNSEILSNKIMYSSDFGINVESSHSNEITQNEVGYITESSLNGG
ncbi:MAG: hypothetical protein GF364_00345, partial [Candidatus Lokiarchaeota archaeon]|nr:hypothetical protein [Candidatus Lokiarchaeota archaeon]